MANLYGTDLTFADGLSVVLMAVLASVGTAGVPGMGPIMLAMVLGHLGLPLEGIGLILAMDRIVGAFATMTNVGGDTVVCSIVARAEDQIDDTVFNDPSAGRLLR